MKYVYNYDQVTKEFISAVEAQIDPAESKAGKKIYLLPAHATFIEPPIALENKIAVFKGEKWKMRSDFRGVNYYDAGTGSETKITAIGKRIPEGSITEAPSLDLIKPVWDGFEWEETSPMLYGRRADSVERVKMLTGKAIAELNEEKAKTCFLMSLASGEDCPEWDTFLIKRDVILTEADYFIIEHKLV
jgi:hypothetical protein